MNIPLDPLRRKALVVRMHVYGPAGEGPWELRAAVDTAASTTMIPLATARKLGYPLEGAESEQIASGGSVFHAPRIVLDRVDVGPASARGVQALCHDLPRETGLDALVGLSFLTRFDVRFDFGAWEMHLAPRAAKSAT